MTRDKTTFDLYRFVVAQEADYKTALGELGKGQKVSHSMVLIPFL